MSAKFSLDDALKQAEREAAHETTVDVKPSKPTAGSTMLAPTDARPKIRVGKPTAGKLGALGANGVLPGSRSGYAKDVRPDRVDGEEARGLATPPGLPGGGQVGRVPAAKRKTGHYEAVDTAEANRRLGLRSTGQLAKIADGLDQPGRPKKPEVVKPAEPVVAPAWMTAPVQPGMSEIETDDDPRMDVGVDPAKAQAVVVQAAQAGTGAPPPIELQALVAAIAATMQAKAQPAPEPVSKQLVTRPLCWHMEAGTYTVPALHAEANALGVIILLPLDPNCGTFIPAPRTRMSIEFEGETWSCYYPGTAFQLSAWNMQVLTLLRTE